MHMGLGDVLDHDRDIEVPGSYRFIIRGRDKPSVFVNEGNRVHRPQVLIVLLCDFTRVHIILQRSLISQSRKPTTDDCGAHLYNLLVGHASQENMLLVLVGMEAHNVRNLAIAKAFQALTCLRVPELHLTVIST